MKKLAIALVLLVPLFVVFFSGEKENGVGLPEESSMEGVRIVNRIGGKEQWSLKTGKAVFTGEAAGMENVSLDLPGEKMTVNADKGAYDMGTGALKLSGNVRAETEDYVIKAGSLDLDSKTNEVVTDGDVVIESGSFRIVGNGFSAKQQSVRILNNVRAEFY